MNPVATASPFVPPEWIAAFGLVPWWWPSRPWRTDGATAARPLPPGRPSQFGGSGAVPRGICPFAAAAGHLAASGDLAAVVLATTCDQMRYAATASEDPKAPLFLFNVPATWQTAAARGLYRAELLRLGRFLVGLGGREPSAATLAETMARYDAARCLLRRRLPALSAYVAHRALAGVRGRGPMDDGRGAPWVEPSGTQWSPASEKRRQEEEESRKGEASAGGTPSPTPRNEDLRLAVVGGPLLAEDTLLLAEIERLGCRITLDATEGGERTLPAPFPSLAGRSRDELEEEFVSAYFDSLPEAFRRPNDLLYHYLTREIHARRIHGILLWRYVWCDTWHAEAARLKAAVGIPVVAVDSAHDESVAFRRTLGRVEAFLETLQEVPR